MKTEKNIQHLDSIMIYTHLVVKTDIIDIHLENVIALNIL
jgi:hypothetical protein